MYKFKSSFGKKNLIFWILMIISPCAVGFKNFLRRFSTRCSFFADSCLDNTKDIYLF